jgi:hypothetical protein
MRCQRDQLITTGVMESKEMNIFRHAFLHIMEIYALLLVYCPETAEFQKIKIKFTFSVLKNIWA